MAINPSLIPSQAPSAVSGAGSADSARIAGSRATGAIQAEAIEPAAIARSLQSQPSTGHQAIAQANQQQIEVLQEAVQLASAVVGRVETLPSSVASGGLGIVGALAMTYQAYKASDFLAGVAASTDAIRNASQSIFDIVQNFVSVGVKAAPGVGVAVSAAGVVTATYATAQQYKANNELSARIATLQDIQTARTQSNRSRDSAPTLNAALDNVLKHTGTCLSGQREAGGRSQAVNAAKLLADVLSVFAAGVLLATAVGAVVVCPPLAMAGIVCGLVGLAVNSGAFLGVVSNSYTNHELGREDNQLKNSAREALERQPPLSQVEQSALAEKNRFYALVHLTQQLQRGGSDAEFVLADLGKAGVSQDVLTQLQDRSSPATLESAAVSLLAKALYGVEMESRPVPALAPAREAVAAAASLTDAQGRTLTGSALRGLSQTSRLTDASSFTEVVGHAPRVGITASLFGLSANYRAVLDGLRGYQDSLNLEVAADENSRRNQAVELSVQLKSLIARSDRYIEQHQGDPNRGQAISAMQTLQRQALNEMKLLNDVVVLGSIPSQPVQGLSWNSAMEGAGYRLIASVARFNDLSLDPNQGPEIAGSGQLYSVMSATYLPSGGPQTTLILKPVVFSETNAEVTASFLEPAGINPNAPNYGGRNVASSFLNETLGLDVMVQTTFVLHWNTLHLGMSNAQGFPARSKQSTDLDAEQSEYIQNLIPMAMNGIKAGRGPIQSSDELVNTFIAANLYFRDGHQALRALVDGIAQGRLEEGDMQALLSPESWELRSDVENLRAMGQNLPPNVVAGLQRELSSLEWLDALSAQTDRHPGNYAVEVTDSGRVRVTGFDHEQSFGRRYSQCPDVTNGLSGLPQLIDRQLHDQLMRVDFANEIRPTLLTLLSGDEVRATESRFNQLRAHAEQLAGQGRVIDHDGWETAQVGNQSVSEFLQANRDDRSSYFRRDA
jgi:hypothetical protein